MLSFLQRPRGELINLYLDCLLALRLAWRLAELSVCAQELRLEDNTVIGGAGYIAWPAGLQPMSEEDKEVARRVGCAPLVQVSFRCKDMMRLFAYCAPTAHIPAFCCQAFERLLAATSKKMESLVNGRIAYD